MEVHGWPGVWRPNPRGCSIRWPRGRILYGRIRGGDPRLAMPRKMNSSWMLCRWDAQVFRGLIVPWQLGAFVCSRCWWLLWVYWHCRCGTGCSSWTWMPPVSESIWMTELDTSELDGTEWYFLALYAILRSIPNKPGGVAAVALVIGTLVLLGWGSTSSQNRCVTGQPLVPAPGCGAGVNAISLLWF